MNFVCKSGFIELKKAASKEPFISVIMMLCPVALGYLSEELGRLQPRVLIHASTALCLCVFLEFVM